jgi:hypothetical protein
MWMDESRREHAVRYAPRMALDRALHGSWFIPMKKMILVALAALSLTACGVLAQGEPQIAYHDGPYDNTANSLGGRYVGGGGGGGGGM